MLSEITIREGSAENAFSHPIQCPEPWKTRLFSRTPSASPGPREGEKLGLEEKGRWFFGECPAPGETCPAEPRACLSDHLHLYLPWPCSEHPSPGASTQRETAGGPWFPALEAATPGKAPRGSSQCPSCQGELWAGFREGDGQSESRRPPGAWGAGAWFPSPSLAAHGPRHEPRRLQHLKIKVCHLAAASGSWEQPRTPLQVFGWSVYDFWHRYDF